MPGSGRCSVIPQVMRMRRATGGSRSRADEWQSFSRSLSTWQRPRKGSVPDKRIRNIPEVVLVRRWVSWDSGNLEGEGWVEGWDKEGSVYKQPETEVDDSCHS
jgi:hypothetical protein